MPLMRVAPMVLALAVGIAPVAIGQSRPNFTGTWITISPEESAGQEEIIVQDERTLSFRHPSEGGHHQRSFRLDGTETKTTWQSHGEDVLTTSRVTWDGATLIIHEFTIYPGGRTLDARRTLTLNASGQLEQTFAGKLNGEPVPEGKSVARRK